MNRQEKLDYIYAKIADKTLSFGCRIFHKVGNKKGFEGTIFTSEIQKDDEIFYGISLKNENSVTYLKESNFYITGHLVMIGDVLEELYGDIRFSDLAGIWKELRKPIEDQSDECVDFVFDLIFN